MKLNQEKLRETIARIHVRGVWSSIDNIITDEGDLFVVHNSVGMFTKLFEESPEGWYQGMLGSLDSLIEEAREVKKELEECYGE